jgi:hypothetical protein
MKLFRDWAGAVEAGKFSSLSKPGLDFLSSNIREFIFSVLFSNCMVCFVQEARR